MPVQPGMKYPAKLVDIQATESESGNFGLFVTCQTAEGAVSRTYWITGPAQEKTREALERLGATDEELSDFKWLLDPKSLCGRVQVEVTTVNHVNEKTGASYVEIEWINSLRKKASVAKAQAAALMMQREPEPAPYVERSRPRGAGPVEVDTSWDPDKVAF